MIILLALSICLLAFDEEKEYLHGIIDSDGSVNMSTCLTCHKEMPEGDLPDDETLAFETDFSEYCHRCHEDKVTMHPVNITHVGAYLSFDQLDCVEEARETMYRAPLYEERYDSRVFCGTCHYPHHKTLYIYGDTQRITVQSGYELCIVCHCSKSDSN